MIRFQRSENPGLAAADIADALERLTDGLIISPPVSDVSMASDQLLMAGNMTTSVYEPKGTQQEKDRLAKRGREWLLHLTR